MCLVFFDWQSSLLTGTLLIRIKKYLICLGATESTPVFWVNGKQVVRRLIQKEGEASSFVLHGTFVKTSIKDSLGGILDEFTKNWCKLVG